MFFIKSTASRLSLLSAAWLLSACSGPDKDQDTNVTPSPAKPYTGYKRFVLSELKKLPYATLVYNGFSAQASAYSNAALLAGDLSAAAPENLYLLDYFKQMKEAGQLNDYEITLPASNKKIQTTLTVLNPGQSMKHKVSAGEISITPASENPVILSIPAGRSEMPETPFFSAGTRYTGVIVERPKQVSDKHTAIISMEASGNNPVVFGAFAHYPETELNLRFYNNASSIDGSKPHMPLLAKSSEPGVIQARFLSLTADDLPSLSLRSMDQSTFEKLGSNSGYLVSIMHSLFPKLTQQQGDEIYTLYNPSYGVFCLGGKNIFNQVDLKHQTFLYPMSGANRQTKIQTVNASPDSGFIVESGKSLSIEKLVGSNTLKLIAVMEDAANNSAVLNAQTLSGVKTVSVTIGKVKDGWRLPIGGFILLAHNNDERLTVQMDEDVHMSGYLYEGKAEHRNKQVVLTALNRKGALGSGIVHRLLAHHPEMQGLSGGEARRIISTLDPVEVLAKNIGSISASTMSHLVNLPMLATSNGFNITGHDRKEGASIVSTHINYNLGALGVAVSSYGVNENSVNLTLGNSITVFSPLVLKGNVIAPSISIGHELNRYTDIVETVKGIHVQLKDLNLSSYFARAMTAFQHRYEAHTVSLAIGLEARQSTLRHGLAIADHTSFSIQGESMNSLNTIMEAHFQTKAADFKISLWNANYVQLQVGLTY